MRVWLLAPHCPDSVQYSFFLHSDIYPFATLKPPCRMSAFFTRCSAASQRFIAWLNSSASIHGGSNDVSLFMPENPNPQGKAALPLLNDLQRWRNAPGSSSTGSQRTPRGVLADYLSALLVLSADFKFRPVLGRHYHLYFRNQQWQLSLVAPWEWRPSRNDSYIAACQLRPDASWNISPAGGLEHRHDLLDALSDFEQQFRNRVTAAETLSADLPHYEAQLPYYQRVLASGLASTLQRSLVQLGLEQTSGNRLMLAVSSDASLMD